MEPTDVECVCGALIDGECNWGATESDGVNQSCNFCDWEGFVAKGCDVCPDCKNYGYFADTY